jgi:amino acid permease
MSERNADRLEHGRPVSFQAVSLADMAGTTVGRWGKNLVAYGYLFNTGTLMVAYIAKSGEIFTQVDRHLRYRTSENQYSLFN